MKNIFILVTLSILIFYKWDVINNIFNPLPDYSANHESDIVLYATAWCGYCEKTRQLFKKHNIAYFEYDIEKSRQGYEQHKNLNGKGIPVLQINGEVLYGYNPEKILSLARKVNQLEPL